MLLSEIPELRELSDKLAALGYGGPRGLTKLLGAARVARKPLAKYLGMDEATLAGILNANIQHIAAMASGEAKRLESLPCRLGAAVERAPLFAEDGTVVKSVVVATPVASAASAAGLPGTIDHSGSMPPIRDQGERGTCVAHACVAAYEHVLGLAGPQPDLSEQFLYWDCKMNDQQPNDEGTWVGVAMPLVTRDGVCDEMQWPYNPNKLVPPNEGQGPPPQGAINAALARRAPTMQISKNGPVEYKQALSRNRCVAFSIPVFNSWYDSLEVRRTGELTLPLPSEISIGGHAMCIVGYADDASPQYPGGGYFILRNSWGTLWGSACAFGPGYGTIPYAYIARHGMEAWIMS